MFMKIVMVAGLAAATFAVVPQQVYAHTTVNVGIGLGGGYADSCGPYGCGYDIGTRPFYGARAADYARHRNYDRRYNGWTCRQGARAVWNRGFNDVVPVSCRGTVMTYEARRHGRIWRVNVNRFNHRIW